MERKERSRKRTHNYTEQEKSVLLSIIGKYNRIIENKTTNAVFTKQKQSVWHKITAEYNSVAVSGKREAEQLRNLYNNMKQKTRKTVAKENREKYNELQDINVLQEVQVNVLKDLKKKATDDKKEIFKTGGGPYVKKINDTDAQVLALIAPQVKPLPNPYDDAASYFADNSIEETTEPSLPEKETIVYDYTPGIETEVELYDDIDISFETTAQNNKDVAINIVDTSFEPKAQFNKDVATERAAKTIQRRKESDKKRSYFAMKLQNAKLEQINAKQARKQNLHLYKLKVTLLKTKIRYAQALLKRVKK